MGELQKLVNQHSYIVDYGTDEKGAYLEFVGKGSSPGGFADTPVKINVQHLVKD